ncbi:unnamed protein product [Caenorhabditis nigoni]
MLQEEQNRRAQAERMQHEQLQQHNGFGYGGQPATTHQQQYRGSMGAQQGLGGYTYPGYSHYQQGVPTSKGYIGCSYSNTQAARSRAANYGAYAGGYPGMNAYPNGYPGANHTAYAGTYIGICGQQSAAVKKMEEETEEIKKEILQGPRESIHEELNDHQEDMAKKDKAHRAEMMEMSTKIGFCS